MTQAEQLDLVLKQEREFQNLRQQQMERDGRLYLGSRREWILPNGKTEKAFTEEVDGG
jgi:hypothetical protein